MNASDPVSTETHYRVLKYLQSRPDATQRELAGELGVSLGKLNYCLKALIEKGWIKMNNFASSSSKKGYIYLLTPGGIEAKARLTRHFLQRKMAEYDRLKREIQALKAEVGEDGLE